VFTDQLQHAAGKRISLIRESCWPTSLHENCRADLAESSHAPKSDGQNHCHF